MTAMERNENLDSMKENEAMAKLENDLKQSTVVSEQVVEPVLQIGDSMDEPSKTQDYHAERLTSEAHKPQYVLSISCMLGFLFAVLSAIACLIPAIPYILNQLSIHNTLVWEGVVLGCAALALILSIVGVVSCRKPHHVGRSFGTYGIVFASATLLVCIGIVILDVYLLDKVTTVV